MNPLKTFASWGGCALANCPQVQHLLLVQQTMIVSRSVPAIMELQCKEPLSVVVCMCYVYAADVACWARVLAILRMRSGRPFADLSRPTCCNGVFRSRCYETGGTALAWSVLALLLKIALWRGAS